MTAITFDKLQKRQDLTHTVYLKQYWGGTWTEEPYLYASRAEWKAAPTIPTATLGIRPYGRGLRHDKVSWEIIDRLADKRRWFVKIVFDAHLIGAASADLEWYGILEVDTDRLLGVRDNPTERDATYESGEQELSCYGLDILLARHTIVGAYWKNSTTFDQNYADIAPDFNARGDGNRSSASGIYAYSFSDKIREPDETWTTREIVRYLLANQVPRDAAGNRTLAIDLEDPDELLPDWDAPVVTQAGRTTLGVINELIAPSRLLGYRLDVEPVAGTTGDIVLLKPFTFIDANLNLGQGTIKANPRTHTINFEADPDTQGVITTTSVQQIDQVVYRGARRRSCCSLSFTDANMEIGWTSALQDEYEDGASTDANYPAASEVDDRQRADAEARSADKFGHVFARFQIPADWNGLAWNGYLGSPTKPVFPVEGDASKVYAFSPRELRILDTLPLEDGHDYAEIPDDPADITTYTTAPWSELPPVVFCPLPEDTTVDLGDKRWVQLDRNAEAAGVEVGDDAQSRTWSASVKVLDHDRALILEVHGAPQHAIAYDNFSGLAHEAQLKWGEYDYENFVFLIGLEDHRYCEGRYPADEDLPTALSFIRRHEVDAGDGYRLDYLVPGTLIGLEPDTGNPMTTDGGYIRDDRQQLEDLAKTAWTYLGAERRAFTFQTHRVNSAIRIGDYITDIGDAHTHTINAVITSITVTVPQTEGPDAGPSEVEYHTSFVEQFV